MTYPSQGYPVQLTTLGGANPCTTSFTQACLIDNVLAQGAKSGYNFAWTGDGLTPSVNFSATSIPQVIGVSGQRMFCMDQTGVIRYDPSGSGCNNTRLSIQ